MILDRDKIWRTAWALVPVLLVANAIWRFAPERSTALRDQAQVSLYGGDLARAAEQYAEAARLDPTSALLAYNAAAAYLQAGRHDEARRWNEEALRRDPDYEPARRARDVMSKLRDPSAATSSR